MDYFDSRPKFSPIIGSSSFPFSIGAYRGKRRVVIAWFPDKVSAKDYLARCRRTNPYIKFDCLQSLY